MITYISSLIVIFYQLVKVLMSQMQHKSSLC